MLRKNIAILSLLSLTLVAVSAFAMEKQQIEQIKEYDQTFASSLISNFSKKDINNPAFKSCLLACINLQQKIKQFTYRDDAIAEKLHEDTTKIIKEKCENNSDLLKLWMSFYKLELFYCW